MTVDLEAIRKRHRKAHSSWLGDYCVECGEWPCDAAVLADEVERLRRTRYETVVTGETLVPFSPADYAAMKEREMQDAGM